MKSGLVWKMVIWALLSQANSMVFLYGQEKSDSTSGNCWQMAILGGTVWGHNEPVYHLAQSHPLAVQLEYLHHTRNAPWAAVYKNPHFGLSIGYLDYRNKQLGQSFSNLIFLQVPLRSWMQYRIGTGLGIHTRPFDLENNHQNLMLGSRVSMALYGQVNFKPLPMYGWNLGLGLVHFSNGSFTQPNSGINTFYLHSSFLIARSKKQGSNSSLGAAPASGPAWSKWSVAFNLSGGVVEKFPVGGRKYGVVQVQSHIQYRVGYKSGIYSGLTLKKNEAIREYIRENPVLGTNDWMLGLPIGHELYLGRLSMITELGFYLIKRHTLFPGIYQRYGLRYQTNSNLLLGFTLNTHRAKAECFELSMGFRLEKSKKK